VSGHEWFYQKEKTETPLMIDTFWLFLVDSNRFQFHISIELHSCPVMQTTIHLENHHCRQWEGLCLGAMGKIDSPYTTVSPEITKPTLWSYQMPMDLWNLLNASAAQLIRWEAILHWLQWRSLCLPSCSMARDSSGAKVAACHTITNRVDWPNLTWFAAMGKEENQLCIQNKIGLQ